MKRGSKIISILSKLAGGALLTLEILDEMWPAGVTRSYYSNKSHRHRINRTDFDIKQQQEFYNLLGYLKKQGFIEKKKANIGVLWKITASGLGKLHILKEKSTNYQAEATSNLKIIVFDIPEKERRKRAWLREVLRILGFKMLQQSVWIGKNKIPEQFLFDLRRKKLLQCIHIMEVTKGGTVKELT